MIKLNYTGNRKFKYESTNFFFCPIYSLNYPAVPVQANSMYASLNPIFKAPLNVNISVRKDNWNGVLAAEKN